MGAEMNIEKIAEPIRVLADCAGGTIRPLRFRWSGRDYKVEAVNAQWTDRAGDVYSLHYSIQAGGQTYYLHFNSTESQWWLDETVIE